MAVDYDVVIIGGSAAGVYAAVTAAHLQARVALVEPLPFEKGRSQPSSLLPTTIYTQAFAQIASSQPEIFCQPSESPNLSSRRFAEAGKWAERVISTLAEQHSPAILATLGVDVIVGTGEFCRLPHLAFVVNNRRLRSRSYLIATGSRPSIPAIDGLSTTGYITPADWSRISKQTLPNRWVVIGGSATGVELAQILIRLGAQVTLVARNPQILSQEEPEAAGLIQAQLEAEGVQILTQAEVTQVKQIDGTKWVLAGNKALETDEILIATGEQPNVESLNLEGVGVKWNQQGIWLNEKLQTTNPRIYACGSDAFSHIAAYEARVALKNALFFPIFKVNYHGIPRAVFSDPPLARVGLTEIQARRRYGKEVLVLQHYFKTASKALLLGQTTGFCKLIVRPNGEILGAAIAGTEAGELIHLIALAIRQRLKVDAIADLPHISPTLSEITSLTAAEWHRQRLHRNPWLQDVLEGFFNFRRSSF
jgi:pyruvate/2-oxoglutarate dehydrogenase complex dihydrolipoamide dehydrogenase (E3) component